MYTPPSDFTARLKSEFNDRLRIRWSDHRGEWQIEQRVGRAVVPPRFVSDYDDDSIRARDGYAYVMAVRPGDRMPCPGCGLTLKVPIMHFGEVRCPYCAYRGREGRYAAAYYPLGDALIQHLRRIDPLRGWNKDLAAQADARNEAVLRDHEKKADDALYGGISENWNRIRGVPQVGYTGRERYQ